MCKQVATPISSLSLMMPLIIIPPTVTTLGPQLSRLPDELLLQIFGILATTMFPPDSKFNTIMNSNTFGFLNRHYATQRIRNVSSDFASLFMEAFYGNHTFNFKHFEPYNLFSEYLTSLPAPLPRYHFRHQLRSMRIEIVLENYYFTPQTDFGVPRACSQGRQSRRITNADQIIAYCPAARQLLWLTNPDYGFCNLAFLHLHIRTDFKFWRVDDAYLRALEEVNFVVTATKVKVVVTDNAGFLRPEYEEVKKRILVE